MKPEKQTAIRRALKEGWLQIGDGGLIVFGARDRAIGRRHKAGYWAVNVPCGGTQQPFVTSASTVIWLAQHPEIPQGNILTYIDGNVANHHLSNLKLTTRSERTLALGEDAGRTQQRRTHLSDGQVALLKAEKQNDPSVSTAGLSRKYGTSKAGTNQILGGATRRRVRAQSDR